MFLRATLAGGLMLIALLPASARAAAPVVQSSPAATAALGAARNALLHGDARRALSALSRVPARQFRGAAASERACMFERFDRASPPSVSVPVHDAFTRDVVHAYQDHWWHALRAPSARAALEARLLERLRTLVGPAAGNAGDFDALAPLLAERLQRAGYHALPAGRTPPLQELMIWRRQDTRAERVELPEGSQPVRLEVLDDFVVRGWSHYARCGSGSAAGWATTEGIFAVRPAYGDLNGEAFRVSLLGHEAQHFADYARFPGLQPWELEYRAKLVELWLAHETRQDLLQRFLSAQGDDTDSPHPHANKRVLQALRQRLPDAQDLLSVPTPALRAAARAALLDDSARRSAAPTAQTSAP